MKTGEPLSAPGAFETAPGTPEPMRSLHTSTFPQILAHFGISVLVTTYQAERLVILRNDNGVLNTPWARRTKPQAAERTNATVGS